LNLDLIQDIIGTITETYNITRITPKNKTVEDFPIIPNSANEDALFNNESMNAIIKNKIPNKVTFFNISIYLYLLHYTTHFKFVTLAVYI